MSLDVSLTVVKPVEVYTDNITHNLGKMAECVGLYYYLWRPDEIGVTQAHQLIEPLGIGLEQLKLEPSKYKKLNPENGWGSYDGFVKFLESYLEACIANPEALVHACR